MPGLTRCLAIISIMVLSISSASSVHAADATCTPPCSAHETCSAPNTCSCSVGWSGPTCNVPECVPACVHGNCTAPGTCTCDPGWTGGICDTPVCQPGCDKHGYCVAPNDCVCQAGWSGPACLQPICDGGCGHGVCVEPGVCQCSSGWKPSTGPDPCSVPICTNPCLNGGNCTAPDTCDCPPGWLGASCNVAACNKQCVHGSCTAPDTCTCSPNWHGAQCSEPSCEPVCIHGLCLGPDACACYPQWTGSTCDTCIADPFTSSFSSGRFTMSGVTLNGCFWKPGLKATVVGKGSSPSIITSGTVFWSLLEEEAPTNPALTGSSPYFHCSSPGICNPEDPIALQFANRSPTPSGDFQVTFSFVMPNSTGSGRFYLSAYGVDQTASSHDFDISMEYNYTSRF